MTADVCPICRKDLDAIVDSLNAAVDPVATNQLPAQELTFAFDGGKATIYWSANDGCFKGLIWDKEKA